MDTIETIDNATARKLIRKALAFLSKKYNVKIALESFSNGEVCIVSEDREIAHIKQPETKRSQLYMENAKECLHLLLRPGTCIAFSPLFMSSRVVIKFSEVFGTSLDEMMINFDLLANKS